LDISEWLNFGVVRTTVSTFAGSGLEIGCITGNIAKENTSSTDQLEC
jgi:hypothetical protein